MDDNNLNVNNKRQKTLILIGKKTSYKLFQPWKLLFSNKKKVESTKTKIIKI